MEYYIYNIPVFVTSPLQKGVEIGEFCSSVEEYMAPELLDNIDIVYIGDFPELNGRNATYANDAVYMTSKEPSVFDMLENFIHEVAHALEKKYENLIHNSALREEFLGKREKLRHLLNAEGYHINPLLYQYTEYNQQFDEFLANEVGYPTLVMLTMGLFVSPYGATSLPEYFANGFEKYFLDTPSAVAKTSPVLYQVITEILDDATA